MACGCPLVSVLVRGGGGGGEGSCGVAGLSTDTFLRQDDGPTE